MAEVSQDSRQRRPAMRNSGCVGTLTRLPPCGREVRRLLCKAPVTKPSRDSQCFVKILDVVSLSPSAVLSAAPETLARLAPQDWEQALALGRLHLVAGRWHGRMAAAGLLSALPPRVQDHLWSEQLLAAERARMVRFETDRIAHALGHSGMPLVLLKGAAYILAGLPPGEARRVSDVDLLVPYDRLAEAEALLNRHGWQSMPHDEYDDHYYRSWMHELPPLQHVARGATLDVHHNLLPRTDRLCPDPGPLFAAAEPLHGTRLFVLSPADMVLHSIVHGFRGGEFINGWRDTLDVHELVTHFAGVRPGFWESFAARAKLFGFEEPAWYALSLSRRVHGTELPPGLLEKWGQRAGRVRRAIVLAALARAVQPELPPGRVKRLALALLYLRSHWVKMPPRMLAKHLWTKYRKQRTQAAERHETA